MDAAVWIEKFRHFRWLVYVLPAVLLFMLFFIKNGVDHRTRTPVEVAVFGEETHAWLIGSITDAKEYSQSTGLQQIGVQDILVAGGVGSLHGPKEAGPVFIFGGKAYVAPRSEEAAGRMETSVGILNTLFLVGIPKGSQPAAVFHLPEGSPVKLSAVYDFLRERCPGNFAVLGIGVFSGVNAGSYQGVVGRSSPPEYRGGRVGGIFFGISAPVRGARAAQLFGRDVGRLLETGHATLTQLLVTEGPPPMASYFTPGELITTAAAAKVKDTTVAFPDSKLERAVILVYTVGEFKDYRDFIEPMLVDVTDIDPTIMLDIRYATTNNFTGQKIYHQAKCYLVRDVAERLAKANRLLRRRGYRLKVFDGYRPMSAHRRLWDLAPDKDYLADPRTGSKHSRGAAVDCTLVTLEGKDVDMGSDFDDLSEKAHYSYDAISAAARRHRELLNEAMSSVGFIPIGKEWWHFDDPNWELYPLRDIPL
ncbi:MAG: D-alanyl-D-alanine dipeptidase [Peptococcaceae bacterium]|nr:D-alanyl-D-alanine dipeptidase [Peptococcaceae bacterium]